MRIILILGATGQVGKELLSLAPHYLTEVVAPDRTALDLSDVPALAGMIAARPWSAVINAAAYTEVDRAESEEAAAFEANAEAPSRLAAESARRGIPLVHISTDYVFDGRKGAPYFEQDDVAPVNAYGRSKLAGERAVAAANARHVILRTAWVYSPYRKNFVKTILRLARERECLSIVADQRGCPTAARDVARACLEVACRCAAEPEQAPYGLYHFAGHGEASWFEFARTIIDTAGGRLGRTPEIIPIRARDYPTPAARAADTRLDCTAVLRAFGVAPRPWREALADTIDRLFTRENAA
jgi:dTDP-4-dehydrorhamnose reductase